jgi:hypothetical protein
MHHTDVEATNTVVLLADNTMVVGPTVRFVYL